MIRQPGGSGEGESGASQQGQSAHFVPFWANSSSGLQATVELGAVEGERAVRKVAGKGLSEADHNTMHSAMLTFRRVLEAAGLHPPKNFLQVVSDEGVTCIDAFIDGGDVDASVRVGGTLHGWSAMVDTVARLNGGATQSEVVLDAKPANWVYDPAKTLHFVDLFPPTLRGPQGLVEPWIPEIYNRSRRLFTFTYGGTRGLLTKLLASSRLTYPDRYNELEQATITGIKGKLPDEVEEYVLTQATANFPDMDLFYSRPSEAEDRLTELLGV